MGFSKYDAVKNRDHQRQKSGSMIARSAYSMIGLMLSLLATGAASAASDPEEAKYCKDKVTAVGRPNTIQSLSRMSAMIQWTRRAGKLGEDYAEWHSARQSNLDCKLVKRSGYYICYASGKPCAIPHAVGSTASNSKK